VTPGTSPTTEGQPPYTSGEPRCPGARREARPDVPGRGSGAGTAAGAGGSGPIGDTAAAGVPRAGRLQPDRALLTLVWSVPLGEHLTVAVPLTAAACSWASAATQRA
jgi:hypothetical protein